MSIQNESKEERQLNEYKKIISSGDRLRSVFYYSVLGDDVLEESFFNTLSAIMTASEYDGIPHDELIEFIDIQAKEQAKLETPE